MTNTFRQGVEKGSGTIFVAARGSAVFDSQVYNLVMRDKPKSEIIIYKDAEGPQIEARFEGESIWLNLSQIVQLFGRDKSVISRHLKAIFKDGELDRNSVVAKNATTAADGKVYQVEYYNLDAVISVGYRVNSKRATQFRIWATTKLRDYILRGYAINAGRLKEADQLKLQELEQAHRLVQKAIQTKRLSGYEKELMNIISDYTHAWILFYQYDKDKLSLEGVSKKKSRELDYDKVKRAIESLKVRLIQSKEAGDLFGREVSSKLQAILGNINQTFGGKELYASREEKAAHLLYFVIKDHPFVDGNKRIGSLLFLLYLVENNFLYNKSGERKINDSALVALALLVAESDPKQKDIMVRLIVNLIIS